MAKTIVKEGVAGLILISGFYGSGKTTAALTLEHPDNVVMMDFDQKSKPRCKALGIDYWCPRGDGLVDPMDYDMDKIVEWTRGAFIEIGALKGKTTLIIDNATPLEQAYHHLVAKTPVKYGLKPANVTAGRYGGTNPGVGRIWENTIAFLAGVGIDKLIVCMHMSQMWAGGAPIDKYRVKGNRTLAQLSNLSLVFIKSDLPNRPPAAIVGKEALGMIEFDAKKGTFKPFMALPPRIPEFTWPVVYAYIEEMREGDKEAFEEAEIPSAQELERYSPWLTTDQKEMVLSVAQNPSFRMTEEEAGEVIKRYGGPQTFSGLVKAARDHGWTEEQVKAELKSHFGHDSFKKASVQAYYDHLKATKPNA